MNTKNKWFVFITLFYIAYLVFPLYASLSHIPIWLMCSAVSIILVGMFPNCLKQRYLNWFFVYFFILLSYTLSGHPFHINGMGDSNAAIMRLTIETAWILPNLIICSIVLKLNNSIVYRWIGLGGMVLLIVSLIVLLPQLLYYSRIMRLNTTAIAKGDSGSALLPGYTLMNCYIFYVPVFLYGIKQLRWRWKLIFALSLILFIYVIIKTEITTSLVALCFLIILSLTYKEGNGIKTIGMFVVISILLWLLFEIGVVLSFVDFLFGLYEGTAVESKLQNFHDMLLGKGQGDNVEVRAYCRNLSIRCFYENPIIGSPGVGGHSSLLDRLGSMGLLGFIPYLLMFVTNVKTWHQFMPEKSSNFFYFCGIVIVVVFLYMKGLFGGEGMLFTTVLLPVSIISLYEISDAKKKRRRISKIVRHIPNVGK